MPIPLRQSLKIGSYLARQKLAGRKKFPLIVELEPLFACNLECNGCGKIQFPTEILRKRLSVEQAVAAIEECRAPMVSIAGGEPLLHPADRRDDGRSCSTEAGTSTSARTPYCSSAGSIGSSLIGDSVGSSTSTACVNDMTNR